MKRKAFVMCVHAGMEEEYEKRHSPIWPELESALKEHGVLSYSIFLHAETRQLFGYVEIEDEGRWEAIADTAVCKKWWAFHERTHAEQSRHQPSLARADGSFSYRFQQQHDAEQLIKGVTLSS